MVHSPEPVLSSTVIVPDDVRQLASLNVKILEAPTRGIIPRAQTSGRADTARYLIAPVVVS